MAEQKKRFDFSKITLPKLTFKETPINGFLVFSLVIFSFLLGMLTNKVVYLEQQLKNPTTGAVVQDQQAYPTPPPVIEDLSAGHLPARGNADAKVTVVEFSDFQCPFCKAYFDDTHAKLLKEYGESGKIKFAYRHYPLSSIHPLAQKAAEAAECANEQNNFWGYHDLLFKEQEAWSPQTNEESMNSFVGYAQQLGMDAQQFRSCLESGKHTARVDEDTTDATAYQVDATPTFFVNGVRVVGAG